MSKCEHYRSQIEKFASKEVLNTLDPPRITKYLNEWCTDKASPKTEIETGVLECHGIKDNCTI